MSKNRLKKIGPLHPCGARPQWIPGHVTDPPVRMLCVRRRKHGGRHRDGRDHQWDQVGRQDNPQHRRETP